MVKFQIDILHPNYYDGIFEPKEPRKFISTSEDITGTVSWVYPKEILWIDIIEAKQMVPKEGEIINLSKYSNELSGKIYVNEVYFSQVCVQMLNVMGWRFINCPKVTVSHFDFTSIGDVHHGMSVGEAGQF